MEKRMQMISKNTASIEPSKIRVMFNEAMKYDNPLKFTVGEPDFNAPDYVIEAAYNAMISGKTKYSANAGIIELRCAISEYLKREIGMIYNPEDEITVTPGAMTALYEGFKVTLNPGDEVILNEPCWTNYVQQVKMCGGVPITIQAKEEEGFIFDIQKLKEAISPRTKVIVINSPCNPTGAVMDYDTLKEISTIAVSNDILVFSDEVYKHILFDDAKHISISTFPGMKERTLVIDSFSKTFAMTGFRVGYAAGPRELIANITKLQENVCACAAMPNQYGALAALKGSREHLDYMVSQYDKRGSYIAERISRMPLVKYNKGKGAFYAFISIKDTGLSSEEFCMRMIREKQVVMVPGDAFGRYGEGYVRISFATDMDTIKAGMDRMEEFLNELANEK